MALGGLTEIFEPLSVSESFKAKQEKVRSREASAYSMRRCTDSSVGTWRCLAGLFERALDPQSHQSSAGQRQKAVSPTRTTHGNKNRAHALICETPQHDHKEQVIGTRYLSLVFNDQPSIAPSSSAKGLNDLSVMNRG